MSAHEDQPKDQQPEPEARPAVKDFEMPDVLLPDSQPQVPPPRSAAPSRTPRKIRLRPIIGLLLVIIGVLFLGRNLGWFSWFEWSDWWPVILIVFGLLLVFRRWRS